MRMVAALLSKPGNIRSNINSDIKTKSNLSLGMSQDQDYLVGYDG